MLGEHTPQIVVVTLGDPSDPSSWSGINHRMCQALAGRGALADTIDGRWAPVDYLEKAATFSRNNELWHQRHSALQSPFYSVARAASSRVGARRIEKLAARPDAILQFGARHDFTCSRRLSRVVRCSWHGGNFALFVRRQDLTVRLSKRHVRRVMDFERRVYDGLDLIFVTSQWLRQSFLEYFAQDPDKVVVVGSGANMDRVPDPPERDFGVPRLLFVGKQFARKGGENLLKAFRLVHAQRPDAELWLVGPRRLEEEHAGVRWFGRIDRSTPEGDAEMHRLYREATAFVMPSLYEPFGIVFLEAMAYRLPCIGGACCAMPEIIEDGVTGYVAPYDVEQLAERLLAVINDPEQARAMGEAGYRRFRERYGWDNVAARMVSAVAGRLDAR